MRGGDWTKRDGGGGHTVRAHGELRRRVVATFTYVGPSSGHHPGRGRGAGMGRPAAQPAGHAGPARRWGYLFIYSIIKKFLSASRPLLLVVLVVVY